MNDCRRAESLASSKSHTEFAAPLTSQMYEVTKRTLQAIFRTPDYVYTKIGLVVACSLFVGFSFWLPSDSIQGFQNVLFSLFLTCTVFSNLVNQ